MSGTGAPTPFPSAPLDPTDTSTSPLPPPSRGHSSHYHHRRSHRHHVTADGRYDDDYGLPQHTEWDLYLTTQQSRTQLLATLNQQKGTPHFAPPRPTPPPAHIHPSVLLSTSPATLTPLAASVLQLAKQYALPSKLDLSIPSSHTPPTTNSGSGGGGGNGRASSGSMDYEAVVGGTMGGRRASLSRRARGLEVQESVDWSSRSRELSELRRTEQPITDHRQQQRDDEKQQTEADNEHNADQTFITSIADTDSHDTAPAPFTTWTECSDIHTAVSRLPSCLHATPAVPGSLSFSRLLSLSPAAAMMPTVVQSLLVSESCTELLHHSLFYCLLLLCASGDDELDRFVAWQAAKRRADAAAEARHAATQSAGTRAPTSAAGSRRRRGKAKEKEAVVRYTYYGEDDQHQQRDGNNNNDRIDTATAAIEDDDEDTIKRDKRAVDDVPPFSPSRPPLAGPTGSSSLSLVPSSHPRAAELSALLQRMSTSYLRLYLLPRPQHMDVFLSQLPAVVADTLHASYLALFPASLPLLHCSLFVERLRETMQALLAGWVATAGQYSVMLPDIRRGTRGGDEKEEVKESGDEERRAPIFLQRRRATIGTSPLIAHFLSSHSIHTPASLSLTMPLSFPVHLSPAALSALSFHLPQPPAAVRSNSPSIASLHTQYTVMRAAAAVSERADKTAVDEIAQRELEARRAALKEREEYARVLVRDSQQSKYKQLKMNAKQIALRRLSQWNGQGNARESE